MIPPKTPIPYKPRKRTPLAPPVVKTPMAPTAKQYTVRARRAASAARSY